MATVRLPEIFLSYGCRRSLVCCHAPLRAPCDDHDLPRVRERLASSEAGRAYLPIVEAGLEQANGERVFRHDGRGRCVHVFEHDAEVGCSLHQLGGLDAMSVACRNYPRWVCALPEGYEAVFFLGCPTAARMLVDDPRPFRWAEVPLETWTFPPTRTADARGVERVSAMRAQWWTALGTDRGDAERLAMLLGAMLESRVTDPRADTIKRCLAGFAAFEVAFVHDALARLPGRGAIYDGLRWEVTAELARATTRKTLLDALDIAPLVISALAEHLVAFGGLHDSRPLHHWIRTVARRSLFVARATDALIARVPYAIDTLVADLISGVMVVDAGATRMEDEG